MAVALTLADIEATTRSSVVARRNFLVGVWAGRQLGLADEGLAHYAADVMAADLLVAGPQDVVEKIAGDFAAAGIAMNDNDILAEIKNAERSVRAELLATD